MTGRIDSGLEIRRILLLALLRSALRGRTLGQLVKDCGKIASWPMAGKTGKEVVLLVVQSLIDDGLLALRQRFIVTVKGREYLEDPSKWQIERGNSEYMEDKRMLWKAVYSKVNSAVRQVQSKVSRR